MSPSSLRGVPDFTHGSVLLSLWFLILLAVATVGFVVLAIAVWLAPFLGRLRLTRRGRLVGFGSAVLAFVFATGTVADGINRHFSYIPTFSALLGDYSPDLIRSGNVSRLIRRAEHGGGLPAHGVVEEVLLAGSRSGIRRGGYVYLPRAYFDPAQRTRRFPVLYMLHGSPGVAADWLRGGFIDRAADFLVDHHVIKPFIVVLPDVNGGYHHDTECQDVVGGPQVQTYLTYDVTKAIDRRYRTIATADGRAIGGLSTGGYCALNLTLRHQDVFSAAVMHSGDLGPTESRYSGSLWGGNTTSRRANTPAEYIPTIPIRHRIAVYCDAGSHDRSSVWTCINARRLLNQRGVPVEVHILDHEAHSFAAWRTNLYLSLPWISEWFAHHTTTQTPILLHRLTRVAPPPRPRLSQQPASPAEVR